MAELHGPLEPSVTVGSGGEGPGLGTRQHLQGEGASGLAGAALGGGGSGRRSMLVLLCTGKAHTLWSLFHRRLGPHFTQHLGYGLCLAWWGVGSQT